MAVDTSTAAGVRWLAKRYDVAVSPDQQGDEIENLLALLEREGIINLGERLAFLLAYRQEKGGN